MATTTSVDYRDFLLVYKAFHLKEKTPNGMICRCGLEKEDTVFSKDEERDIEENVDMWGYHEPLMSDSFRIETIMVPTSDDDILSTKKLKKIFRDLSPCKRLMWCGRLLIQFHEENQCSMYLSSALKFYLKQIEMNFYSTFPIDIKFQKLLSLSTKFSVHQSVFLELLRLLITPEYDYRLFPSIDDDLLLENIFRAANELKMDILVLWKKIDSGSYHLFNCFIYERAKFLIPLIKFGKTECISRENDRYLASSMCKWAESITENIFYVYNSTTFRALQTLRLFFPAKSDFDPTMAPYALKLLWNSITEPFLCEEEFKKSVIAFDGRGLNVLTATWDWYVNHVLENVISPRGPRSLAHLSRCSVRRQLATCLQLPCGVDQLDVPKILKDYILLEDCKL